MKAIRISLSGSSEPRGTFGESSRCSRRVAHALTLRSNSTPLRRPLQRQNGVELLRKVKAWAKRRLIHDHVDHCLDVAANGRGKPARAVVSEFKAISRYL